MKKIIAGVLVALVIAIAGATVNATGWETGPCAENPRYCE